MAYEPRGRVGACASRTRRGSTTTVPARASYNELRLTPRTEVRQTALETRVVTVPASQQYSYIDYWGTHVIAFNVDRRHEMLSITGNALVDTLDAESPDDCSWDEVADASSTMSDHLGHRYYTQPTPELAAVAESLRAARPLQTVRNIFGWTNDALCYHRGVTGVHTSAAEAFADGAGVCQDFAHLSLALIRSAGVPSRYVSGYFHPERRRHHRRGVQWGEPRMGRGVDRKVVGLRPNERRRGGRASRRRRSRPRLCRCPTGQGHLRGQRRQRHAGRGPYHPDALSRGSPC